MNQEKERYFQHYKGGLYKLLCIAKDSETLENVVVYQAMYKNFEVWVRLEKNFFSEVIVNGIIISRFREITKAEFLCLQKQILNI